MVAVQGKTTGAAYRLAKLEKLWKTPTATTSSPTRTRARNGPSSTSTGDHRSYRRRRGDRAGRGARQGVPQRMGLRPRRVQRGKGVGGGPMRRPLPPDELTYADRLIARFAPTPEVERWALATFVVPGGALYNPEHSHLEFAEIGLPCSARGDTSPAFGSRGGRRSRSPGRASPGHPTRCSGPAGTLPPRSCAARAPARRRASDPDRETCLCPPSPSC